MAKVPKWLIGAATALAVAMLLGSGATLIDHGEQLAEQKAVTQGIKEDVAEIKEHVHRLVDHLLP